MRVPRLVAALIATFTLVATPAVAFAETTPADPTADTMHSVTVAGITLQIAVDSTGHLASVDVGGSVAEAAGDAHGVKVALDDGGTKVSVRAKHDKVEAKVATSNLADVLGQTHTWSGELFGPGAGDTTLEFAVSDSSTAPELSINVVETPGTATTMVGDFDGHHDDDDEVGVWGRVEITYMDVTAKVTFKVEIETHDGVPVAKLKISVRSPLLSPDEATGPVDPPTVTDDNGEVILTPRCDDDHDDDKDHEGDHDDDGDHHGEYDHDDDCDDHDHYDDHDEDHDEWDGQRGDRGDRHHDDD